MTVAAPRDWTVRTKIGASLAPWVDMSVGSYVVAKHLFGLCEVIIYENDGRRASGRTEGGDIICFEWFSEDAEWRSTLAIAASSLALNVTTNES